MTDKNTNNTKKYSERMNDEIKVGKTGEWEGVKVVDDVIYIIEDDEN